MSFIISIHTHEGLVLAADSRQTLNDQILVGTEMKAISCEFSDATRKLFCTKKGVGIATCGDAGIGRTPIAGFIDKFTLLYQDTSVEEIPALLIAYFKELSGSLNSIFHVGGYDSGGKQRLFRVSTKTGEINEVNASGDQGAIWNGETDVLARIVQDCWLGDGKGAATERFPRYFIPWQFFSLQDAIDFAVFAMEATIGAIRFEVRLKTVGGPIDLLAIRPDGATWVRKKELHAGGADRQQG